MIKTTTIAQPIEAKPARKTRETSWLWLLKIAAGVMIVLLLALHFVVNHLIATTGLLSYGEVVSYYKIAVIPFIEVAFLIFVIAHALIGLRSIVLDLAPGERLLRALDWLFIVVGVGCSAYGIWLVWVIAHR